MPDSGIGTLGAAQEAGSDAAIASSIERLLESEDGVAPPPAAETPAEPAREAAADDSEPEVDAEPDAVEAAPEDPDAPKVVELPEALEGEVDSIDALAKALGVESDNLTTSIVAFEREDGTKVSLAEALQTAKEGPILSDLRVEVANREREVVAREAAVVQNHAAGLQEIEGQIERLVRVFEHEDQTTDWQTLKRDYPDEYRERREQMEARRDTLVSVIGQFEAEKQKNRQSAAAHAEVAHREQAETAWNELMKARPEWAKDADVRKTDAQRQVDYLRETYAISDPIEFFKGMPINHIYTLILDDAARYRELVGKRNKIRLQRKVADLPKVPAPGVRSEPADEARKQRESVRVEHKLNGSIGSAARAIENMSW